MNILEPLRFTKKLIDSLASIEGKEFCHSRVMVELVDLATRRFMGTGRSENWKQNTFVIYVIHPI